MQLTLSIMEQQPFPFLRRTGRHENASARLWTWRPTQRRRERSLETRLSKWALVISCSHENGCKQSSCAPLCQACSLETHRHSSHHKCMAASLFIICLVWIVLLHRWQMKWSERWIWNQRRFSWLRVPCGQISLRVPLILPVGRQMSSKHTTMTLSSSANSEMRYRTGPLCTYTAKSMLCWVHLICFCIFLFFSVPFGFCLF